MARYIEDLADRLSDGGLRFAFGVAGGGLSLELIDALDKKGVRYYPVIHEASAALMAGACGRDGKLRAAAITIKGPGFANAYPGVLSNFYEDRPAVTLSEAYGPSAHLRRHKRLDHRAAASTTSKGYVSGKEAPENVKALFSLAERERPGPVHIDVFDEASGEALFANDPQAGFSLPKRSDDILERIKLSKQPVLILGSLAARRINSVNWESIGIPVLTTAAAKGVINENSVFAGGVITGEVKALSPENTVLKHADLAVAFGLRSKEMVNVKAFSIPLISIDAVSGQRDGFGAEIDFITPDVDGTAVAVTNVLSQKKWGEKILDAARKALEKELFEDAWMPAIVFRKIQSALPDSVLVLDTGLFCTVGETVWRAKRAENFLGSPNGRFMGTSVPTAIGAAIASGDHPVVSVAGDGGIGPYFGEIKMAVEEKLPIIFILMSDGRYGSVAVSGIPKGLLKKAFETKSPSWRRAFEAIGCKSASANSAADLESLLGRWQPGSGPLFIEMRFDPDKYLKMTESLR